MQTRDEANEKAPRRRADVLRLFDDTATPMPAPLAEEAHQVAQRVFCSEEPGPVSPGDEVGGYRIEHLLGAGGQAYVYEATHKQLGRRVALKIPRSDLAERILHEARLAARLDHPHVVRVEDVSAGEGTPFMVMERCTGGSLDHVLEMHPEGLPLPEVRRIGQAILEALAYAHSQGIVHRDVKPSNVLFDAQGVPKLADLGTGTVATHGPELAHSIQLTGSHPETMVAGTPLFMAPEQEQPRLLAGKPLDGRADLFAFGKMIFLLLTGASPRTVRPPSRLRTELDPVWDEFVFKLLEEDRDERFSDGPQALDAFLKLPFSGKSPPEPVLTITHEDIEETSYPKGRLIIRRNELPTPTRPEQAVSSRRIFAVAAFLYAGLVGLTELNYGTSLQFGGWAFLPPKLGMLLATLALAGFSRRERSASPPTSPLLALGLSSLIGAWAPLMFVFQQKFSWLAYRFEEVGYTFFGLSVLFWLVSRLVLWAPTVAHRPPSVLGGIVKGTFLVVLLTVVLFVVLPLAAFAIVAGLASGWF